MLGDGTGVAMADALRFHPRHEAIRFPVDPRDVPPVKAARRLHMTLAEFNTALPRLVDRGFPRSDPDTGNFDLKAIDAWMDRRSGLTPETTSRDPVASMRDRIKKMRGD